MAKELTKIFLKELLTDSLSENKIFKRNLAKECLQVLVLDFIYSNPKYSQLIFYGGSCLCHCFGLPRLSEDLDFVDIKKKIKLAELAKDLERFFKENTDLGLTVSLQKFRIYLKFPILQELGLARTGESVLLFLKIEVFRDFDFCRNFKTEIIPIFKFNKSVLIRTFDLPTLMATKLRAVLLRKWVKTNRAGKTLIRVKGRDYFDLMWYLEKAVQPNIGCLGMVKNKKELKEKLLLQIAKIDSRSIRLDLGPLIKDSNFIKNLSKNIKEILRREIREKL